MLAVWYPTELLDRALGQPDVYCILLVTVLSVWALSRIGRKQG
jgi:hypothetical protein